MVTRRKKSAKETEQEGTHTPATEAHGGRLTTFEGEWLTLAQAYGGVGKLADAAGVSYPTLYRYAVKGDHIPAPVRIVLGMLAATKRIPPPPMSDRKPKKKRRVK